jgi:hypothetical protein
MAIDLEQIETIRGLALDQMQVLLGNEQPTVTVNDEEVAWAPWLAALERTVDWCDRKLGEYDPYEVRTRGET